MDQTVQISYNQDTKSAWHMTSFTKEIEINASKEKVWDALANVGDICHAHPAVATSEERVTEWIEGESSLFTDESTGHEKDE